MSLESWKAKFYPVLASGFARKTWLAAVEHSIKKWTGLSAASLKKHGLQKDDYRLSSGSGVCFEVAGSSCALCHKAGLLLSGQSDCSRCVLSKIRNGVPCDEEADHESLSPYSHFTGNDDPKPMLSLLRKARMHILRKTNSKPRK